MKCPSCGWIIRKVNGEMLAPGTPGHPCAPKPKRRTRKPRGLVRVLAERMASREEQQARYLDAGPAAWDDR